MTTDIAYIWHKDTDTIEGPLPLTDPRLHEAFMGGEFFEKWRRVEQTHTRKAWVSTVFLAIDHSFYEKSEPVLFETMLFHPKVDEIQVRYCTSEEARAGHWLVVKHWLSIASLPTGGSLARRVAKRRLRMAFAFNGGKPWATAASEAGIFGLALGSRQSRQSQRKWRRGKMR